MNITGVILALYFVFVEKKPKSQQDSVLLGGGKSVVININKPVKLEDDKK